MAGHTQLKFVMTECSKTNSLDGAQNYGFNKTLTLNYKRTYSDIENLLLIFFLQEDYSKTCKTAFKEKVLAETVKLLCSSLQSLRKIGII